MPGVLLSAGNVLPDGDVASHDVGLFSKEPIMKIFLRIRRTFRHQFGQWRIQSLLLVLLALSLAANLSAQPFAPPDPGEPGDEMIQAYLAQKADRIHASFVSDLESPERWKASQARFEQEYLYMLGLWPLPEKTPLKATVTGTYEGTGFVVENLHFQSRPRLYVTGNLYRPANLPAGLKLPAVLYVCGHAGRGHHGNKTAYQSHGIWFARHGYVCLMIDTLQLGEIAAVHHGTYRENRWWWHARGYTSAGVECWNGIRALDYLESRPDVDRQRLGITGISGGGAATFWIAAADKRARIAVPVSGMADLPSYINHRVIDGHCDCMFLYNTFRWPWARIASLIAPRPMLFVNSDQDRIFPMDANERISNRMERLYSLFGKSADVDTLVSIGGHAYRQDIRQGIFRFFNRHLQENSLEIKDSEVDLVVGTGQDRQHPIPLEQLRVFADDNLPADEWNTTIDQRFVPIAEVASPSLAEFSGWRSKLKTELAKVVFGCFPKRIPTAKLVRKAENGDHFVEIEPLIQVWIRALPQFEKPAVVKRVVLVVRGEGNSSNAWLSDECGEGDWVVQLEPRGTGATRWTQKNPPNYVARAHVLIGETVDTGRIRDVIATARLLKKIGSDEVPVVIAGQGRAAGWAAYAALWEDEIDQVWLNDLASSHQEPESPQLLNVLRVCDIPDVVKMLENRAKSFGNVQTENGNE